MTKDIGSIYPLSKENINKDIESDFSQENKLLFSLCREALYSVATLYSDTRKKVLLPAYTCDTVIAPFRQLGWDCSYFAVDKLLRINKSSFIEEVNKHKPNLVVVHPYYGMDFLDEEIALIRYAKKKGSDIIIDLTQCIYSKQYLDFVDFYVGSYRKWYPIPDGGFLFSTKKNEGKFSLELEDENIVFASTQFAAMVLRQMYFESKDEQLKTISRNLIKAADYYSEERIKPHVMSNISKNILAEVDDDFNRQRRLMNYQYLFNNISRTDNISFVCNDLSLVKSAPLYFPVYVKDRGLLQKKFIESKIYAPVLWPVEDEQVLINEDIEEIYDTILVIPIDQRYGIDDMKKIVNIINS